MYAAVVRTEAGSIGPNDLITKLCVVVEIVSILLFPGVKDFEYKYFTSGKI